MGDDGVRCDVEVREVVVGPGVIRVPLHFDIGGVGAPDVRSLGLRSHDSWEARILEEGVGDEGEGVVKVGVARGAHTTLATLADFEAVECVEPREGDGACLAALEGAGA
jgi:hypothetical protein